MPVNLTGSTIATTYGQILHVDGGPEVAEKIIYSGTGVATALKIGTTSASVENIQFNGNTIATLNTDGNLTLSPNGTGSVVISKVSFSDASQARTNLGLGTMATQNANAVALTGGTISGVTFTGSFSGLTLVESTTLATSAVAAGVNLNGNTLAADGTDTNIDINITPKGAGRTVVGAFSATSPRVITGVNDTNGNELLKVTATASAVNELTLANAATGNSPTLSATGDDTNVDINITPKGTGEVNITNIDVVSGKVPFNTITNRAYASFYDADTADQTGSTTAATAVQWATAAVTGAGITIASDSRITLAAAGTYRINASLQFHNSTNTVRTVLLWFAIDGTNIADSTAKITVPANNAGGTYLAAYEIFVTVTAGQYVEMYWYPSDATATLHYIAPVTANPGVTPAIPAVPPAIVVVERIA
jgi:hypothetical protein